MPKSAIASPGSGGTTYASIEARPKATYANGPSWAASHASMESMSSASVSSRRVVAPRARGARSHIRVVAPWRPFVPEWLASGLERLRTRYVVSHRDDLHARHGFLAGDDDRRRSELLEALADDRIDVILCARGGYGATRIVGGIDADAVARAHKPIVGFSDVTAL